MRSGRAAVPAAGGLRRPQRRRRGYRGRDVTTGRARGPLGQPGQHVGDHPARLGRVRAVGRLAAQQRRDHRGQRARRRRPGRVFVDDGGHGRDRSAALLEGAVPFDRREQGRAERPQVGGRRRILAADPLGGGESGRAHHHAGLRELGIALEGGDAEVSQDRPVVLAEQHVARLDVPVHHPGAVRDAQRGEQLPAHLRGPPRRQRTRTGEHLVQGLGVDQLHDDPGTAFVLGYVVHGHDGRVVEPGGGLGLAQRPLIRVGPLLIGERIGDLDLLDRHITVKELIAGTPDHAHGAAADGGLQAVPPGDHPSGVRQRVHRRTLHGVR